MCDQFLKNKELSPRIQNVKNSQKSKTTWKYQKVFKQVAEHFLLKEWYYDTQTFWVCAFLYLKLLSLPSDLADKPTVLLDRGCEDMVLNQQSLLEKCWEWDQNPEYKLYPVPQVKVKLLVAQPVWLHNPKDCNPPGFSVHGFLQARILEWVSISTLGDLPIQGSNQGLLYCRWILYHLSHKGSPVP